MPVRENWCWKINSDENLLSGAILPSEGSIYMNGELINIKNPEMAHNYGISTVYQVNYFNFRI